MNMSLTMPPKGAMQIFVPLCKIDEEKRLVYGIAAVEKPDKAGEIMDYATAKPAFTEWSNSFSNATNGMSKGNVRVMHNPKLVAGKLTDMTFDDDNKAVHVCAKIVDDAEWQKTLEGCYTGFSIGGGYGNWWADGALKRYTPKIAEISLVDSPCIPGARIIELQKADGSVTEIHATGRAPLTYGQMVPPKTYGDLAKGLGGIARMAGRGALNYFDRAGDIGENIGSYAGGHIGNFAGRAAATAPAVAAYVGAKNHVSAALSDRKRDEHGRFAAKIDGAYEMRKGLGGFARIAGRIEREAVHSPRLGTPVRPRIQSEGRFSARLGSGMEDAKSRDASGATHAPRKTGRGRLITEHEVRAAARSGAVGAGIGAAAGYGAGRRAKPFASTVEPDEHRRDEHGRFAHKIDGAHELSKRRV